MAIGINEDIDYAHLRKITDDPYMGTEPCYIITRRQGYKVLITEKNLVFYKVDKI